MNSKMNKISKSLNNVFKTKSLKNIFGEIFSINGHL